MLPVESLTTTALFTADGGGPALWIAPLITLVVGLTGIGVTVVLAWRKRRQELADRRQQAELEAERTAKLRRRDEWAPEHKTTREHCDRGEDIARKVRRNGPLHMSELAELGLEDFCIRSERLAAGGVVALRQDMDSIAKLAAELTRSGLPPANDLPPVFAAVAKRTTDGVARMRRLCRIAIEQDRAATALLDAINAARARLRDEWGSDHEGA